jgi:hypothetical protein
MSPSTTLYGGMDVHQESIAVAYVAQEHGADVVLLGSIGTRPCDIAQLIRKRPSKATPLVCVYETGPCGSGRSRYVTTKGHLCWVVAPSLIPQKAGDRVNTDRRDAIPWARLRRSGELTPLSLPAVEDEASRDLRRARDDASRDLNAAKVRLNALLLRPDLRDTGRATWGSAPLRGLADGICATPAPHLGRGGHRPRTDGLHVGHDPSGPPARLDTPARSCLHEAGHQDSTGDSKRRRPGAVSSSCACSGGNKPARLDRGRHPTDIRQVGPHPRISAGAPVVSDWRRLCRSTRAPQGHKMKHT